MPPLQLLLPIDFFCYMLSSPIPKTHFCSDKYKQFRYLVFYNRDTPIEFSLL